MLHKIRAMFRREAGDALPFALVALAVGTLLISPLLAKVSSSFNISSAAEASLKRHYAADAAAEMAVWKLTEDEDFREQLLESEGMPLSVSMGAVNGTTPTIEIVAVSAVYTETENTTSDFLPWALFGNNHTAKQGVNISGAGHRVYGGIHANYGLKIDGAGDFFYGPIEWSVIKVVTGNHTFDPPISTAPSPMRDFPITWNADDYRPGGDAANQAVAEGMYHNVYEELHYNGAGVVIPPGLYYAHGDVKIDGAGIVANNVTIMAEGVINIAGAGMIFTPYIDGLTFFSTKSSSQNVISISGAGNTGGASYAPEGKISLTGAGGTIVGAFLGDTVDVGGAGATITLAQVAMTAPEPELLEAIYDVRATAAGTELTARIKQEQLAHSSWVIRNPNADPVAYTWEIVGSDQLGAGTATPGSHVLTTASLPGSEQARITWLDQSGTTQMAVADITLVAGEPTGTVSDLVLTSLCSPDPTTQRVWRIRNPNTFVMTVNWDVYGTAQAGSVLAPPGDSYLVTQAAAEPNTTRIHWLDYNGGYHETVKASGTTTCEGEAPVLALNLISGGRTDATTPTFTIQSWDMH